MSDSTNIVSRLPARASKEHLRKQAKRLAKADSLLLARAQRRLARDYGFANWAAMMRAVDAAAMPGRSPLSQAAAQGDVEAVRGLLADGAAVDGDADEPDTPLFMACDGDAPADGRLAAARLLVDAGAFTRAFGEDGATALHAAARRGPAAMVELLLRNGALAWQGDNKERRAYDYAKAGTPIDRERILFLLAPGPKIVDSLFRQAVDALQAGDIEGLGRLLDAHPRLLRERAVEPDIGPRGYFSDPKLFWFVANNPTLIPQSPANIVDVAGIMIARGVDQADLDYTLALVMTNGMMPRDCQIDLVRTLFEAGAKAGDGSFLGELGHRQTAAVAWLIDHGVPLTVTAAAGLGRIDRLPALLAPASPDERAAALDMAVINQESEATRLCLEAGADPNRFMACHSHSTPLHQAALGGDLEIMALLVEHGARLDVEDTMWRGTPLGWASQGNHPEAVAWLRGAASRRE